MNLCHIHTRTCWTRVFQIFHILYFFGYSMWVLWTENMRYPYPNQSASQTPVITSSVMCCRDTLRPKVRLWDLPGAGTSAVPAETYLQEGVGRLSWGLGWWDVSCCYIFPPIDGHMWRLLEALSLIPGHGTSLLWSSCSGLGRAFHWNGGPWENIFQLWNKFCNGIW